MTAAAVIYFVYTGLLWLAAAIFVVLGLVGGSLVRDAFDDNGSAGAVAAIGIVVGLIVAAIGVLTFFIGRHLLLGRNWARITAIVLSALGLLAGLGNLANHEPGSGGLGLVLSIAVLLCLTLGEAPAYFRSR